MKGYKRIGLLVAVLALVPLVIGTTPALMSTAVLALVLGLFAIALNIAFGHTNQLYLFLGALGALGAYMTIIPADVYGVPLWVTLPLGMAVPAIITGSISYISAKQDLTVIVIAILTLNIELALSTVYVGASEWTGGSTGYIYDKTLVPDPVMSLVTESIGFHESAALFYLVLLVIGIVLVGYVRLINSRYGMAFDAIRSDEQAAKSVGVDAVRYKTLAGIIAGALIGLAGVLYAEQGLVSIVTPGDYSFQSIDVLVLIMLVFGGLRTTIGPIVGAVLIVLFDEILSAVTEFQVAAFGALLILLFLFFREGLVPALEDLIDRVDVRGRGGGEEEVPESGVEEPE